MTNKSTFRTLEQLCQPRTLQSKEPLRQLGQRSNECKCTEPSSLPSLSPATQTGKLN